MRSVIAVCVVITTFVLSCHPGKKGIFGGSQTAHQAYKQRLEKAGLLQSSLARQWLNAAEKSLADPSAITLPHKEAGYFAANEPAAAGLICNLQRGATLNISVRVISSDSPRIFVELWSVDTSTNERKQIAEADSVFSISHEVEKDGVYLIRLQPELLASMEYMLTVNTEPSLAFPVSESGKPAIISVWNDKRDAGRNHEGVDIGAKFRTAAVSAADGYVRSVTTNRLGGKVVFMRPEGKDYTLYYAHLDSQVVSSGQNVSKGDTIGLVGNTGNAINTPPHLHFGIYARGGAVDPLPFIDKRRVAIKEITASKDHLNKIIRANKKVSVYKLPDVKAETMFAIENGGAMQVLGATGRWYRVQLPNGAGYVSSDVVTDKPFREIKTDSITKLLDQPFDYAASMTAIPAGTTLNTYGLMSGFYFVKYKDQQGWVKR